MNNELNISQLEDVLNHIIINNKVLVENNITPNTIAIRGNHGIGKTSLVKQIAEKNNLDLVKLNLAQLDDLGDLIGFPIREHLMINETTNESKWVSEVSTEDYTKLGFSFTEKNRTSYCPPNWISNKSNGGILLLDDFNRAQPQFIQATMDLINEQKYISWELPSNWTIVLTLNPDNGDYNVNSLDNAQQKRYFTFDLIFDINCWAEWAENKIDDRCINFLLKHSELINDNLDSRSITKFFNSISTISDFKKNRFLISLLGKASVGNEFTNLFIKFINDKLDLLPTTEYIFNHEETKEVIDNLNSIIKQKDPKDGSDVYKSDIASIIITRCIIYLNNQASIKKIKKSIANNYIDRLEALVEEKVFTEDMIFNLVSSIYKENNRQKYSAITSSAILSSYIL